MMDFRQRLEQSRNRPVSSEEPAEQDDHFSCPYFATDRTKSPACLELRMQDGIRKAIPYAYFTEITFDAEAGIEILTSGKRISITGRNLSRLFDYLVIYRVRFVQSNTGSDAGEDELFVKQISVDELSA